MFLPTGAQMREIDKYTIERLGISGRVLMENAGAKAALVICSLLELLQSGNTFRKLESFAFNEKKSWECPNVVRTLKLTPNCRLSHARVAVLCGKGNNGGDGYVVARHLFNKGANVKIYQVAPSRELTGDALVNAQLAEKLNINMEEVDVDSLNRIEFELSQMDILVDALLGTGVSGPPRGIIRDVVSVVNSVREKRFQNRPIVVSLDVPSGVDSDTGNLPGDAVSADLTVTFGFPKLGLMMYPGREVAGNLVVADISIPALASDAVGVSTQLVTRELVRGLLPRRPLDAHKGTFGKVLVVAGSEGMTGAASLASEAALRSGAGLVTLGIPQSLNDIMEVKLTEVMTAPLLEDSGRCLGARSLERILELAASSDAVALGPGLGRGPSQEFLTKELVMKVNTPLVIDADGLNNLASRVECLAHRKSATVLTPHAGEMARLTGQEIDRINENRLGAATSLARASGCVVVLKGASTVVAAPDGKAFINPTGNSGMATGGTGDVLTGLIAGLLAQGLDGLSAALAGVYVHGLAGDLAANDLGQRGMIAGDLVARLPIALKLVEESADLDLPLI